MSLMAPLHRQYKPREPKLVAICYYQYGRWPVNIGFARFYVVVQRCQLGTHTKVLKIVCGLRTQSVSASNVEETRIRDASHGMVEIHEFCFKESAAVCLFWNFFVL